MTQDRTHDKPQLARALALSCWMVLLTGAGVVAQATGDGAAPAPCASPSRYDGLLRCDGVGARPGARAWLAGAQLDVNGATQRELEAIAGVGPSLASAILAERGRRGRYDTIEDLDDVPGIGPKTLEKLRRVLTVR